MIQANLALAIACCGALLGVAISSLEYFWLGRRAAFAKGGFWPRLLLRSELCPKKTVPCELMFSPAFMNWLLLGRTAAALASMIAIALQSSPVLPLLLVMVATALLQIRIRWGGEGGDHMTNIILIVSTIGFGFRTNRGMVEASCCFLAAQLALAYFSSGVAKCLGPLWRSGQAFTKIMANYGYGSELMAEKLRRYPMLAASVNYSVMLFEFTFPIYFLLRAPYCYVYLTVGVLFHLGVAFVMRLHLFLYTFVTVYPCLVIARDALERWLLR